MATGERANFSGEETFTAPSGGVTKGKLYQVASGLIVVARETVTSGTYLAGVSGVYDVTKTATSGITFSKGGKVYFDSATNTVTNASTTTNTHIGYALEAVATATTAVVKILLLQPAA